MIPRFTSYVLCGTPRSGSTLLCEMLAITGVAGRPNSYFRVEDIAGWADSWGVPHSQGIDAPGFDRAYLDAMRREGRAGTDVFGLRLMWGSTAEATRRLNRALGREAALPESLEAAFGRVLHVHVSRNDKVAQAVSLLRAEQSGLWHLAADGSVLEGVEAPRQVTYDGTRIAELVSDLINDDRSWSTFFETSEITPLQLVYEEVAANPKAALRHLLAALELDPDGATSVTIPTSKLGDDVSQAWAERFRREAGA